MVSVGNRIIICTNPESKTNLKGGGGGGERVKEKWGEQMLTIKWGQKQCSQI